MILAVGGHNGNGGADNDSGDRDGKQCSSWVLMMGVKE